MYSLGRSRASHRSTSCRPDLSRRSCRQRREQRLSRKDRPPRSAERPPALQPTRAGPWAAIPTKNLPGQSVSADWHGHVGASVLVSTPSSGHTYGSPGEPDGTCRCGWALMPVRTSYETAEPAWAACLRPAGPPNSRSSGPTSMLSRAPSRRLHLRYFRRARRYMPLQMSVGIAQHII